MPKRGGFLVTESPTSQRARALRAASDSRAGVQLSPEALAQSERLVFRFQRFHVGVELRSERFLSEMLPVSSEPPAA